MGWALFLDLPLLEDDKFWWVPKAWAVAEGHLGPALSGALPAALTRGAAGDLPDQWAGGLPDYGHPPLFFYYLGAATRLLGTSVEAVHRALIPLGLLSLVGTARLARCLGGSGLTQALAAALLVSWPVVFAQGLRADLDLPLLAVTPFALAAALEGRWRAFAALAWLATWCKEPGVLLTAAAGVAWLGSRWGSLRRGALGEIGRGGWLALAAALQPLVALGAWGLWHRAAVGWALASPERLPDGGQGFVADLGVAARWLLLEQGRWWAVGIVALGWILTRARPRGEAARRQAALLVHVAVVLCFFSAVGFFGASAGRPGGATHLRYFLPALPALAALAAVAAQRALGQWAWAAAAVGILLGLADLRGIPWGGPERNLFGADLALARRALAEEVRPLAAQGARVWVGMSEVPDLQFPAVGTLDEGIPGLLRYGPGTPPEALEPGDRVIVSAYGEPPGLLKARLAAGVVEAEVRRGRAWVRLVRVGAAVEPERP